MRKNSSASGCSAFIRWYCCIAGVTVVVGMRPRSIPAGWPRPGPLPPRNHGWYRRQALRVIAIDTSSERASVALVENGAARGEVRLVTALPSVAVLPAVDFLLRASGLATSDVEGYAVAGGPGSVTGGRGARSTGQGVLRASGPPCIGL